MTEHDWIDRASELLQEYEDAQTILPEKLHDFRVLEKMEKPILAGLASQFEGSENAKDRQARCTDEYQNHVRSQAWKEREYIKARGRIAVLERKLDFTRTILSLEKAKINLV